MPFQIRIRDYGHEEEQHPHHVETMQEIIELLPRMDRSLRILELGAGTGILTQCLAALLSVGEIDVVEYDSFFHPLLERNVRRFRDKVNLNYDDSWTFKSNNSRRYDAIVSFFANHHIRPTDRQKYFENVKQNLTGRAVFIVGDEFLREQGYENDKEYAAALQTYHRHVIDMARGTKQVDLAELEEEALNSRLNKKRDFKISCVYYERMLRQAGFEFKKYLIGADDPMNTCGVYVYHVQERIAL